ncbi:MAG: PFL family protein, partial [Campylobacter sp.]
MDIKNVTETIAMIEEQNFDIRTITMGISLLDCIDPDIDKAAEKIYAKITDKARDLVKVGNEISAELGIPIVNKRVCVTPIAIIGAATNATDYVPLARAMDEAAQKVGIDFIGGFSALVQKGYAKGDKILIDSIPAALAATQKVCSSVNIGSTKTGINMSAVADMGRVIKETARLSDLGAAKLVVFANAVEDNPFMAGAFHGVGEAEVVINVGVSGPGVVKRALEKVRGASFDVVAETVKKTAFKITRIGQLVGQMASERLGVKFGIVDLSLAPTPAVGDSVARVLEEMGLERVGTHGTTAALALLNDAVKKGGVMACNQVGGLSGAFIPVSEDEGMIAAVRAGSLSLEKLEAMTAICSVGLDMIAIPQDTPEQTIAAIIADEAAIGVINQKTTAVRIIPKGKEGDTLEFGGLLGSAPVMSVN